jgi:hypothetical protein
MAGQLIEFGTVAATRADDHIGVDERVALRADICPAILAFQSRDGIGQAGEAQFLEELDGDV